MRVPQKSPDWTALTKDIQQLISKSQTPEYEEMLRRCESGYWPWEKLRFIAVGQKLDPVAVWLRAKLSREPRYKTLPLDGEGRTPLRFNTPDALQHELMLIDQQLAGGLTSTEDTPPSGSQRERFIVSALQEEAIASSMLEGAITTRQEAKKMLSTGRRPHSRGEQMVLNNYQAIQFIRAHRNISLSPDFLLEVQKILTDKTLDTPEHVGRFRNAGDTITIVDDRDGEVMHTPPPAHELARRLERLCDFANRPAHGKDFIHPVISACVLHFQMGFDHPFCDGNGRTARAVFYWMMLRSGYWLFEYLPISRLIHRSPVKYARSFLFCETDNFDITYFLMYKAKVIELARQDLRKYIAQKQNQITQARQIFSSDTRLNHRQREIVLQATRSPDRYFTIMEHQNKSGVSYATARKDFLQLEQWKYVKSVLIGKRFEFVAGQKISQM